MKNYAHFLIICIDLDFGIFTPEMVMKIANPKKHRNVKGTLKLEYIKIILFSFTASVNRDT